MPTPEESYQRLLERLIRFCEDTTAIRAAYVAAAANPEHSIGSRRAAWHKAKVLGRQCDTLHFMLSRNREQAEQLGLAMPELARVPLGSFPMHANTGGSA